MKGIYTRYIFLKKTFKNTIIFLEKGKKISTYFEQKELLKYLNYKNIKDLDKLKINYVVVDNMSIKKIKSFKNNNYLKYYMKYKLFDLSKKIINIKYK